MSLSNPKIIDEQEPERYYEWMLWKMKQEDKNDMQLADKLQERINRSKEYSVKTVDERAEEIIFLKDRIKRLEEDMAYMKKEAHE
tara:strand:- start:559 stop:813 length:255 start_codon:yes stop_codon:yes gene_type:complete